MPSVLLTDALLRSIKPGEKLIEYWDTRVSGLCLRISPGGVRTWTFRYRPKDSTSFKRLSLGRYLRSRSLQLGASEGCRKSASRLPVAPTHKGSRMAKRAASTPHLPQPRRRLSRTLREAAQAKLGQRCALPAGPRSTHMGTAASDQDQPRRRGCAARHYREGRADEREPHPKHPFAAFQLGGRKRAARGQSARPHAEAGEGEGERPRSSAG